MQSPPTHTDALAAFRALCARRALGREPVQYLVGRWDFHRIALEVRFGRPVGCVCMGVCVHVCGE